MPHLEEKAMDPSVESVLGKAIGKNVLMSLEEGFCVGERAEKAVKLLICNVSTS